MRTLDRLIELWEVTSGERQRAPHPSFACSKDRNGRCQFYSKTADKVNVNICRFERSNNSEPAVPSFLFVQVTTVSTHSCNVMSNKVLWHLLSCVSEGLWRFL